MKDASGWRSARVGNVALQYDSFTLLSRVGNWNCGHQGRRVRMQRFTEEIWCAGHFHELAEIHHGNTIRNVPHNGEIVRYEKVRETSLKSQIREQVEYLCLYGHVERRHGFV